MNDVVYSPRYGDIVKFSSTMSALRPELIVEWLKRVQTVVAERHLPCYIVGGLIRDQLLQRPLRSLNVDLAVPSGALELSRVLAGRLHGAFVPLDEAVGTGRVVIESAQKERLELDISDFRGATLEEDLRRRDFTINAMAVELQDWLRDPHQLHSIIDPLGGRRALQARQLIACFPETFAEDPIRLLRAFRFSAQLAFAVSSDAVPLMRDAANQLARVSSERVRDELLLIFDTDDAAPAIASLNALGILDVIIPELIPGRGMSQGDFHHLDVLGHQLETIVQSDRFLKDFAEFSEPLRAPMTSYCAEQLVERRSRKSLIKLAGLLHDVGKPARRTVEADGEIWFLGHEENGAVLARGVVERLRLSNRETDMVCQLVLHHLRPGFLSREPQLTRRAVYRFFRDLGEDGPGCLLTWWADRMATRGSKSRLDQIDQQRDRLEELLRAYFFQAEEVVKPPRLVDGHQLMQLFQLPSGPVIGTLLAAIEEAQAEGRVQTAEEALALARQMLQQQAEGM